MSRTREPFDPFLSKFSKFSAAAEGKASALIEETEGRIRQIKNALHLAKKWEEGIYDGFAELTRTIDKFLGDDQSITKQPLKDKNSIKSEGDFLSTEKGKQLLVIAKRVQEMASKVLDDFRSSTTASSSSLYSEGESKELPVHEEELQRMAEKIIVQEPRLTFLRGIYDELDPQLKQCLLCFSVFPENIVIKRRVMIYWWVGEGLVVPSRDGQITAEKVGEDCFKTLILSHLIQPIYQKHSKTAKYCKIYPWVRHMLVSKTKEPKEEFFTFDSQGFPTFNSSQCKRACLVAKEEKAPVVVTLQYSKRELRSIFNLNAQYISWDKDQLRELEAVVSLQLGRWQNSSGHHIEFKDTKFLDGLQFLKELRYLSLEGISRITELPKTIAGLNNLLILNLRSCHNLEKVTQAVTSITSLTHLDVSECYLLDRMPQGIGSITNLQVLKGFVVGSAQSTDSCRLSELTQLKKLWKLSIRIGSEAVHIGEDLSELSKIESLLSLKITWGQMKSPPLEIREPKPSSMKTMKGSESMESAATLKERTVPPFSHPYLEKLVLECVPDDVSVSWLTPGGFPMLKRLYIAGGKLRKLSTVTENDGWNVEILRLKFLKELKLEWVDLKMKLRQLRCAQIYECSNIVSSSGFDDKGYWVRNDEEASSSSMAGTSAPVRMRNKTEASSSSLAGTTAPVPIRNEGEASSSYMAGTSAPV